MFTDTMQRWLQGVLDYKSQFNLTRLFYPLFDRMTSLPCNSAGLVIHGSASALAKTGSSDFYALASGKLVKIAASTDMPALVGTVAHSAFNVFCFFVDSGGNKTSQVGTAGATLAAVVFPQFPDGKALVGFLIINPTGTGSFVGGTTALDDATVAPNTAYISPIGGFDPACVTGLSNTP